MSRDPKSSHYDAGGIETLDIINAKLSREQYSGYLLGSALAYLCRMNFKENDTRDAEKAANYTRWLHEELEARDKRLAENRTMAANAINLQSPLIGGTPKKQTKSIKSRRR